MPVQATQQIPAAFPSFMSVFGEEGCRAEREADRKSSTSSQSSYHAHSYQHHHMPSAFVHRTSVATPGSESIDYSPTTTVSTFDSASITASTDPSPSSSPESPTSAVAISPFKSMMSRQLTAPPDHVPRASFLKAHPAPHTSLHPESPGNKARNVKNLSLNVDHSSVANSPSLSGPDSAHPFSAPTSPIKAPLRSGRRKPTNLTIQTPGFEKTTFIPAEQSLLPPTPGRPSLRHFESSPALPSLLSPSLGPSGGMQFPNPAFGRLTSQPGSERSSISNQSNVSRSIIETPEEDADALRSQEVTERGYINGPVCVYDSGLYLYLEPTEEEAMKFDVVVNVAKEVTNPFAGPHAKYRPSVMSTWRNDERGKIQSVSEPHTAISETSFRPAFEWPAAVNGSNPAASSTSLRQSGPEYIHVPWDHNSEILDDLEPLCELIDSRITAGKSVLVHCQLGVSRSASLVIAYGLYKKYHPDFHSMYAAVKERSRWVGPNMSLIYQLMDFRSKLSKQNVRDSLVEPTTTIVLKGMENDKTPKAVSHATLPTPPPLPPAPRMVSSGTQTDFEPFYSLPSPQSPALVLGHSAPVDSMRRPQRASPRPLPFREKALAPQPAEASPDQTLPRLRFIPRPTIENIPKRPVALDLSMQDAPETPSLFSPRATEFVASPFARSMAGDLSVPLRDENKAVRESFVAIPGTRVAPREVDPRSPHHLSHGSEILRSIDDLI